MPFSIRLNLKPFGVLKVHFLTSEKPPVSLPRKNYQYMGRQDVSIDGCTTDKTTNPQLSPLTQSFLAALTSPCRVSIVMSLWKANTVMALAPALVSAISHLLRSSHLGGKLTLYCTYTDRLGRTSCPNTCWRSGCRIKFRLRSSTPSRLVFSDRLGA
jgi:hypothetical protein